MGCESGFSDFLAENKRAPNQNNENTSVVMTVISKCFVLINWPNQPVAIFICNNRVVTF